jgi:phospholipid/cholesterol/gamma-HCH transport system substrate-binding protein
VVALVAAATFVVKVSYGALSNRYPVTAYFVRAGQGLEPSAQVQYRGVTVGEVTGIFLVHGRARVDMKVNRGFSIPTDAVATIAPQNVFGDETVNLSFPHGSGGPALAAGGTITHTSVSDDFTQLLAAADPLLNGINAGDLATVISQLAIASAGLGPEISRSIQEGTQLADLFDQTLQSQIQALDSFTSFSEALAPVGPSINSISAANNQALPAFNAVAASYQKDLENLTPLANELASYLSDYHPDIAAILQSGANVSRVLIARQSNISQVVSGLARYLYKFANGAGPEILPDGSKFAYFKTFILFSDVNQLVCSLIAPAEPGLSALAPLQQALTGSGTPFNCSAQMASFQSAQAQTAPTSAGLAPLQKAAQNLSNALGAVVGQPDKTQKQTPLQVIKSLLGSGS